MIPVLKRPLPRRNIRITLLLRHAPEQNIHVLQTAALRLGDEAREGEHASDVDRREHEEQLVPEVGLERRRHLCDDEVWMRESGRSATIPERTAIVIRNISRGE